MINWIILVCSVTFIVNTLLGHKYYKENLDILLSETRGKWLKVILYHLSIFLFSPFMVLHTLYIIINYEYLQFKLLKTKKNLIKMKMTEREQLELVYDQMSTDIHTMDLTYKEGDRVVKCNTVPGDKTQDGTEFIVMGGTSLNNTEMYTVTPVDLNNKSVCVMIMGSKLQKA